MHFDLYILYVCLFFMFHITLVIDLSALALMVIHFIIFCIAQLHFFFFVFVLMYGPTL